MDIRPVGSNEIRFPTRIKVKNNEEMVYEPNDRFPFPPKLKAIIILPIPKDIVEITGDKDGTTDK